MNIILMRVTAILAFAFFAPGLLAQEDEIGKAFKKPDAAEEARLRELLAKPLGSDFPAKTLAQDYAEKLNAVNRLGDDAVREALLREAVRLMPDADIKWILSNHLLSKGAFEEGNALALEAVAGAKDPFSGVFIESQIACNLLWQNEPAAASASQVEVAGKIQALEGVVVKDRDKHRLMKAAARNMRCLTYIEEKMGHFALAVQALGSAERNERIAVGTPSKANARNSTEQSDLADIIAQKIRLFQAIGRLPEAEAALADLLRLSREAQLKASQLGYFYASAGDLRFSQREFVTAEQLARKADSVFERMGKAVSNSNRLDTIRDIAIALVGQKKWPEALQEIERGDAQAGNDPRLTRRVRFNLERAIVYFGNQHYIEAAKLFGDEVSSKRKRFGDSHFFTAEATGLQGAALWRSGIENDKVKALAQLKSAVSDYMSAANADYLENVGIRKELREIVFSAYLEAMANSPNEDATLAIGAADWVRGGIVQEALSDAAVRSAAGTPALADVVRREQDAKNEVSALRRFLSGEAGAAQSPLPEIAVKMRDRITLLENERVKLRAEIKAKFPDYDRLVRPPPPTIADIAQQLSPEQGLLMVLPTPDAVYVWAVAADRPAAFARASLSEAQVNALVTRLRAQLDFDSSSQAGKQFDSAAAFEIYDKLFTPVAKVWKDKPQFIVAAGGALSQLPFAVLQTKPGGDSGSQVPWLIREVSIAQVPSISSWLAIKTIAKGDSAGQAFIGWGDPNFGTKVSSITGEKGQSRNVVLTRANTLLDFDAPKIDVKPLSALTYADIPALPDTRDELLGIARVLKADANSDVLLGSRATRASVLSASQSGQLAKKRVLAFATHGLMAGDLPNLTQPALAMAANGTDANNPLAPLLTLEDVLTLKLNADWVVLSACNTAAADGRAGEALSGLARGFFYAGSRSLLVTNWAVESESAKLLTTATFEHYAANPQSPKAESLRQAMLKVMAIPGYSHPAYWAPYALVGDGGR